MCTAKLKLNLLLLTIFKVPEFQTADGAKNVTFEFWPKV
jgi:hypothetical protein